MKHFILATALAFIAALAPMSASAFERMAGDNDTILPVTCSAYPTAVNLQNAVVMTDYVTHDQVTLIGGTVNDFPDCADLSYTFAGNSMFFGSPEAPSPDFSGRGDPESD